MPLRKTILGAMLAPLVLGGCAMPLSVQVASLIADGVSLATTEKTLGDHALSAVAQQDCAIWRFVNGEDVCHEAAPDGPVMVAETAIDAGLTKAAKDKTANASIKAKIEVSELEPVAAPEKQAAAQGVDVASLEPVILPMAAKVIPENSAPGSEMASETVLETASVPASIPVPTSNETNAGTYYVLASFRRIANAERLARNTIALSARVVTGTAKGGTVYRVAVGPVSKAKRRAVRGTLIRAGFIDAWALTMKAPKIVVEVAALN
ncbi:MAG: SPOR domain-containing protein [Alphaproteobacteria bacterium]|nr:SPOR domain-containing protein [Alphaproteobacteria bacterium]